MKSEQQPEKNVEQRNDQETGPIDSTRLPIGGISGGTKSKLPLFSKLLSVKESLTTGHWPLAWPVFRRLLGELPPPPWLIFCGFVCFFGYFRKRRGAFLPSGGSEKGPGKESIRAFAKKNVEF